MTYFSREITKAIEKAGLTPVDIASEWNIDSSNVRRLLKGAIKPFGYIERLYNLEKLRPFVTIETMTGWALVDEYSKESIQVAYDIVNS